MIALCFLVLFALSMAAPQFGFGPLGRPFGGFGGRIIERPFIGRQFGGPFGGPFGGRGFYPGGFNGPFRGGFYGKNQDFNFSFTFVHSISPILLISFIFCLQDKLKLRNLQREKKIVNQISKPYFTII